jgi:hypothetical protein
VYVNLSMGVRKGPYENVPFFYALRVYGFTTF